MLHKKMVSGFEIINHLQRMGRDYLQRLFYESEMTQPVDSKP